MASRPQTVPNVDNSVLRRTNRVLRIMQRRLETDNTLRTESWPSIFGRYAVDELLCVGHLFKIIRDVLKIKRHEISDDCIFTTWNYFDSDNTGTVTRVDCIGKMRRYTRYGLDSLVGLLHRSIAPDDIKAHAARMVDIADNFCKNDELTIAEMETFLPRTEYEGFLHWFLDDHAKAMKQVDNDKSMSLTTDELEMAYESFLVHQRAHMGDNRKSDIQLPKKHNDPWYPGSLAANTLPAGQDARTAGIRTLRDYKRINNYSSIDSQYYCTIGVDRSEERLAAARTQVAKLNETLAKQSSVRKKFDMTCHTGLPRYQITPEPIKAYTTIVPEDAFVPTPYHGVRSINDKPVLIKGQSAPPSEAHFMQEVARRRGKPLWLDTLEPDMHWSDRLAALPTNSFMMRMADRTNLSQGVVNKSITGRTK